MDRQSLIHCQHLIAPYIHRTPVLTSRLLNQIAGAALYFKCENFQRMGAFKMRGAAHALLQLSNAQRSKGVATHSSGNFAQALSLAAKSLDIPAYIVMPENAPSVKKAAVRDYGGQIIECESTLEARERTVHQIMKEKGATFIHPSDDMNVILGQGTAAIELLEEHPELNAIFTPIGGGGLIGGTALAAHHFGNNCKVFGGEPFGADDAFRSMQSGKIESNEQTNTIADGLRPQLGEWNFPIILKHVEKIIRVTENEIIDATRLVWERMKIIIEPSSGVALAALLKEREHFKDQKIGIIISGGNVAFKSLPFE